MQKRTLEIIAVCKGDTRYDSQTGLVDAVKNYMSDTCLCDKVLYTDNRLENILVTAFYDFVDVCDRPSFFLKQLEEFKWLDPSLTGRICAMFQSVEVWDGYKYVNGFNADYENIAENLRS